jgi:hypothetical protein
MPYYLHLKINGETIIDMTTQESQKSEDEDEIKHSVFSMKF